MTFVNDSHWNESESKTLEMNLSWIWVNLWLTSELRTIHIILYRLTNAYVDFLLWRQANFAEGNSYSWRSDSFSLHHIRIFHFHFGFGFGVILSKIYGLLRCNGTEFNSIGCIQSYPNIGQAYFYDCAKIEPL